MGRFIKVQSGDFWLQYRDGESYQCGGVFIAMNPGVDAGCTQLEVGVGQYIQTGGGPIEKMTSSGVHQGPRSVQGL